MTTTVLAADLPSRRAPPVYSPPPPIPFFTWTGFYLGGNAGYAFSTSDTEVTTAGGANALGLAVAQGQLNSGTVPVAHRLASQGFIGGGQLGYNFQIANSIVAGVETDFDYVDEHHNDVTGTAFNTTNQYHSRLSYLGTVRGRLGYAFDRLLVYGTGGFAYGSTGYAHTFFSNGAAPVPIFTGSRNGTQTGYAVGGGIEYALPTGSFNPFGSGAVTIKAEYLYYDLGVRTTNLQFVAAAGIPATLSDRYRTAGNIVRAGLNFKFGDPAVAPVVARY